MAAASWHGMTLHGSSRWTERLVASLTACTLSSGAKRCSDIKQSRHQAALCPLEGRWRNLPWGSQSQGGSTRVGAPSHTAAAAAAPGRRNCTGKCTSVKKAEVDQTEAACCGGQHFRTTLGTDA